MAHQAAAAAAAKMKEGGGGEETEPLAIAKEEGEAGLRYRGGTSPVQGLNAVSSSI